MAGVESRKEKRAADGRSMSRNKAAEIVIPLRDVPGTMARAWEIPIQIESIREISPRPFRHALTRSPSHMLPPTTITILPLSPAIRQVVSAQALHRQPQTP